MTTVIIAAHPDDELLTFSPFITSKHLHIIYVFTRNHPFRSKVSLINKHFDFTYYMLDYEPLKPIDLISAYELKLKPIFRTIKGPFRLITHLSNDPHQDHKLCYKLSWLISRQFDIRQLILSPTINKRVLYQFPKVNFWITIPNDIVKRIDNLLESVYNQKQKLSKFLQAVTYLDDYTETQIRYPTYIERWLQ